LVDLRTKDGAIQPTSELTVEQRKVLKELEIELTSSSEQKSGKERF